MIPLPLVIESEEGGKTLFRPDLDETYHSKHGAIQESLHVFIKEGLQFYLDHRSKRNIAILEMGFGTGLNAMLTYLETKRSDLTIHYCGLESEKLPFDLVQNLGYEKHWGKELQDAFEQMHTSNWDQSKAISEL
jgi:tRNA U34 5-methylaminomethyl-2-thiouridine-forming methyltransferase MnmC